jgi:pimeloyl-ACP methyl ester carboxylesterase
MGGGGTTIASGRDATLKTSIGLAAWGPQTSGVQVPTLLLCGASDSTAPCSTSQRAYSSLPNTTQKMMVSISGATHFSWFTPTSAGGGISGETALAFQKVFLDGDERWRPLLVQARGSVTTNIQ